MWVSTSESESNAIADLYTASDRAVGIVGASLLEQKIEILLKEVLLDFKNSSGSSLQKDMFRGTGPFGSFGAKINLAAMLGIISEGAWKDIDIVRKIRNQFAHNIAEIRDFKSSQIEILCNKLEYFTRYVFHYGTRQEDTPKDVSPKFFEQDLDEQLAAPRRRYLLCVKIYTNSHILLPSTFPVPSKRAPCRTIF